MAIDRQLATLGTQTEESPIRATMPKPPTLMDKGMSPEMMEFVTWSDSIDRARGLTPARERTPQVPKAGLISFLASNIEAILDWKDQIVTHRIYRPLNNAMRPKVAPRGIVRTIVQDHLGLLRVPTGHQKTRNPELVRTQPYNNGVEAIILQALNAKDRVGENIENFLNTGVETLQRRASQGINIVIEGTANAVHAMARPVVATLEWSNRRYVSFQQWDRELTANFLTATTTNLVNLRDFSTENISRIHAFVMSPEGSAYRSRVLKASLAGIIALGVYRMGTHVMELNIEDILQKAIAAGSFAFSYAGLSPIKNLLKSERVSATIQETIQWATQERVKIKSSKLIQACMAGVLAATILPGYMAAPTTAQTRFALYREALSSEQQNNLLLQEVYEDVQLHPERIILYLSRGYATVEGVRVPVDMSLLNFATGDQVPLRFVDSKTGELLFTAHKRIWNPNTELSAEMVQILKDVESAPYDENIAAFQWLANVLPRAIKGDQSGGTTPDMGVIKLTDGKLGEESLLTGSTETFVYHPELYGPDYLSRLAMSVFQGKVPNDLVALMEGDDIPSSVTIPDLPSGGIDEKIAAACMKLESLVIAQRLIAEYGEENVIRAWASNLPFAAAPDSHLAIQGVPALAEVLFGKQEEDLSKFERIIIARMIHQPGFYINDLHDAMIDGNRSPAVMDAILGWIDEDGYNQGLLDVMVKKGQITPEERDRLIEQGKNIKFVLQTPDGYINSFLGRAGIAGEEREISEEIYNGNPGNRFKIDGENASQVLNISPTEITVGLDIFPQGNTTLVFPELTNTVQGVESASLYGPALQQYIDTNLVKHEQNGKVYYTFVGRDGVPLVEYTKGKARELRISEFEGNPGIMVASSTVLTGTSEVQRVSFDGTEGILESQYVQPGSTIKLIMWSIALKEGIVKDFYNDQIFYHPARVRLALNDTRMVRTNGGEWEMISPAEALVSSRNQPVLEVIQKILYSNLPLDAGFQQDPKRLNWLGLEGTNNAAKNEVRRRWNEIIQGNMRKFGVIFCDINGNELTEPTGIEAIGTDVFIKDPSGSISSLQAFSDSFLAFADPDLIPEVGADPELSRAVQIVGGALTDPKLRSRANMRWGDPDGGDGVVLGGKGGTSMIGDNRTIAIAGAFFSVSDSGFRAVVTYQVGQRDGVPLNLDDENKHLGVGAESAAILQLSRDIILRSNDMSPSDVYISRADKQTIIQEIQSGNTRVAVLKNNTKVYALSGQSSIMIEGGQTLDLIGRPINFTSGANGHTQRQKVVWIDEGQLLEGYIYMDGEVGDYFDTSLKGIEASDAGLVENTQAVLEDAIEIHGENDGLMIKGSDSGINDLASQNLLIIGNDEPSPTFRWLYENISATGELGRGAEISAELSTKLGLPADTIILNKDQLLLYVNEAQGDIQERKETVQLGRVPEMRMGYSEDMLYRIMDNLLRQKKIQNLIEQYGDKDNNLNSILWKDGRLTPAGVLLYSLSDEGVNSTAGYRGGMSTILMYPFDNTSPVAKKWERLREIGQLYREIQNYNTTPVQKKRFYTLVRQLSTSPSKAELEVLGINTTVASIPVTTISLEALRR